MIAAVAVMALAAPAMARQQQTTGRVTGRVFSSHNGEPVASAQVFIQGSTVGALTDLNGRYVLVGVPAGQHDVAVQTLGYAVKTVSGVQVTAGGTATLDITVTPQAIAMDAIVVEAAVERGNTTALLTERRLASNVTDAIGRDQISNSPDGTAAAALQRVPGVSVVDGKYVYVRGLGERYSNTTLNGAPLPSPEPDKKVVPLDLIPSGLLESVVTSKTYSPDQPGDYAGGLVQIKTRDFPAHRTIRLSTGFGFNTEASFGAGLGHRRELGFFAFGRNGRDLPSILPRDQPVQSSTMSPQQIEQIGEALSAKPWGPVASELPANYSLGLSVGDEWEIGDKPVGFLFSLTHGPSASHNGNAIERVFGSELLGEPEVDFAGQTTTRSVSSGALANLSLRTSPRSSITLAAVYNRNVDDESRILEGYFLDSNADLRNTRLRYLEQTLLNTQLSGDHLLGFLGDTRMKWRGAVARATRYEPDTRQVLYRETPAGFRFEDFVESGSSFHQDLGEDGYSAGLDLDVPFTLRGLAGSLSLGASLDMRKRDVFTRRFRFTNSRNLSEATRRLPPDELFVPANIGPNGMQLQEATFREDNYDATQDVHAGYVMADAEILPRLRVVTGARIETTSQKVQPVDLFATPLPPLEPASLEETDILPALNLTYGLSDRVNLRVGISQTLARPQLRELAPFTFANYAGGFLVIGNPTLGRTRIRNLDARWELFTNGGGVLAVSGFYKQFIDPIEVVVVPSSEFIQTWVNASDGTVYGVELELRTDLGMIASALEAVSVIGNLTLSESSVMTGDSAQIYLPGSGRSFIGVASPERALQGQSPYVANVGLSYGAASTGTRASLLYNRFGRRIDAVGARELPDIFEEARDQLDLTIEQSMPGGLEIKATASRLLGNVVEFTQGGDLLRRYETGRTFSISLGWELGRR
jgi:hypothetical protein